MNIAVITFRQWASWMHTLLHTRVQKGVRPDGLPSEDLPEDPKAFIFQRFRGDADSSWQYGHLTDVSEHIVHIDGANERSVSPVGCPAKQEATRVC